MKNLLTLPTLLNDITHAWQLRMIVAHIYQKVYVFVIYIKYDVLQTCTSINQYSAVILCIYVNIPKNCLELYRYIMIRK